MAQLLITFMPVARAGAFGAPSGRGFRCGLVADRILLGVAIDGSNPPAWPAVKMAWVALVIGKLAIPYALQRSVFKKFSVRT